MRAMDVTLKRLRRQRAIGAQNVRVVLGGRRSAKSEDEGSCCKEGVWRSKRDTGRQKLHEEPHAFSFFQMSTAARMYQESGECV